MSRIEHDLIGNKEIPEEVYYGVQTARAKENFHITGITLKNYPAFIIAFAQVKKACALANNELNLLPNEKKDVIVKACDEIISGKLHDHFVSDMIQGGAGTSVNMNANEVIANRALEMLGHKKGEYQFLHPNNDVNLSQSTNDSYPTAMKVAIYARINDLLKATEILKNSFAKKGEEFKDIIKMGRTQLQDAVPMTLGQEFHAYSVMLEDDMVDLKNAQKSIAEMNLGATAIGTGINSHPDYSKLVEKKLQEVTGQPFVTARDLICATPDAGSYVTVSNTLKKIAIKISKVCSDLRLLSSGPRTGIGEINLPAMQPGSSIMPGKVNPVIPEAVNQLAYQVIGADLTVTLAAEGGQLELNVFEPVLSYAIFNSLEVMCNGFVMLAEKCVDGITANKEKCRELALNSIGLVTALNPYIGYENSTSVAKEALETGGSVYNIVLERKLLTKEQLEMIIKPENMIKPRAKIQF